MIERIKDTYKTVWTDKRETVPSILIIRTVSSNTKKKNKNENKKHKTANCSLDKRIEAVFLTLKERKERCSIV